MRLTEEVLRPKEHDALTNVQNDDHHEPPTNLEVSNTTQVVAPLPGGPGQWDIALPHEVQSVMFSFRSANTTAEGGGKAGVIGVANQNSLHTTTASLGGHGSITITAYNAIYSKRAAALNLSHKVFDSAGADISLTAAYIIEVTGTWYLRTEWTNYSAGNRTLNVYGEIQLLP